SPVQPKHRIPGRWLDRHRRLFTAQRLAATRPRIFLARIMAVRKFASKRTRDELGRALAGTVNTSTLDYAIPSNYDRYLLLADLCPVYRIISTRTYHQAAPPSAESHAGHRRGHGDRHCHTAYQSPGPSAMS